MTIKEKREALRQWCIDHKYCEGCPLREWPESACIFTTEDKDERGLLWPDSRVEEAYNLVTKGDVVNRPAHYTREGAMECIDEMVLVFGVEAVKSFCLCNIWKYRYRAADKNGEEDIKKSDWYMRKYQELCGR